MTKKRNIFEEVDSPDGRAAVDRAAATAGAIDRVTRGARAGLRRWLIALFGLVVLIVMVGGLTRLTDSGLSITEWKPITGMLPPLSAQDWAAEFERYRAIPEFRIQNGWMELDDFKMIYWWEWGHRQLGRFIGLFWAVGFAGFALTRRLPTGWAGRLWLVGALIGVQGAIGWWMVSSGLDGARTDVASPRLATHLGTAFVILAVLGWFIFTLGRSERDLLQARRSREKTLQLWSSVWLALAFAQILIGALVAGIDAGRSYTDWPLMGGQFLPPDPFLLEPWWRNWIENPGLVQFIHRMMGYLLAIFGLLVWLRGRRSAHPKTRDSYFAAFGVLMAQVVLGIATVMAGAPWSIAIFHQIIAIAVWVLILRTRFLSQYPVVATIRRG